MKILLVAEESAGIQLLRALAAQPYEVVGVVCREETRTGGVASLHNFASQNGYQTWPAEFVQLPQFANFICRAAVDVLLNVHSLYILNRAVIEAPQLGSFNLHPGPLPEYAGLHCPSRALYHGETTYGVTLHRMTAKIDAGPVVYRENFEISPADTALSLYLKCVRRGIPLILQMLTVLEKDPAALPLHPQNLARRRYYGKTAPQNGQICWAHSARQIADFVRACDYRPFPSPWGFPRAVVAGQRVGIVQVRVGEKSCSRPPGSVVAFAPEGVWIATGDGLICVEKIIVNGRVLPAAEYLPAEMPAK